MAVKDDRHHRQRRDRAHRFHAASGQCAGADPRRGRARGGRRSHHAAAVAGRAQCRAARRSRAPIRRRGLDDRSRCGAGAAGLHRCSSTRRRPCSAYRRWARRSRRASISTAKSRWRRRWPRGLPCCAPRARAGSSMARSRTRYSCPDCRSSSALAAQGFFGRVTGFRLDFGWWVFDGSRAREPAAELELPAQRRRRAHLGHVPALALRHRGHPRTDPPRHHGGRDRGGGARGRGGQAVSASMSTTPRSPWPSWRAARSARSRAPGRRACAATTF